VKEVKYIINAACHIHCMIHLHLKLGRDL
jgi:hypothetical protein